jgi:sec-independent protein translocase protein TatB
MIDFNASEIVILVVLAVIIFGPDKLPTLARKAARVLSYVRNIANDAQGKLREELGPEFSNLNLADLNPKALVASALVDPVKSEMATVRSTISETVSEVSTEVADVKAEVIEVDAEAVTQPAVTVPFDTEAT